jgi:hypothetical protein
LLWHTSDFTINLAATDSSGISATYYKINGGSTQSVSVNGQPRITVESGTSTLEYWGIDSVDNEELPHKTLTQIKLDKTTPTGSIQINNGESYTTSNSVTLTLSATDAVSGVSQVRYSNDGSTSGSWESASASKAWTLVSGDGAKTVYYQIKDNAGLTSSYSATITLQSPTPTPTPTPSPSLSITPSPTPTVPEFPALIILPLFAIVILLSMVFIKKRIPKK